MMTIKHITPSGEEFVHETTHVNFVPAAAKCATGSGASLWRYDSAGQATEIVDGLAYVMNDGGTTVARYDLEIINNPGIGRVVSGALLGGSRPISAFPPNGEWAA